MIIGAFDSAPNGIDGSGNSYVVFGQRHSNAILGTSGANFLQGTIEPDIIRGLGGNDLLFDQAADDTLEGGNGDDRLNGGEGNNLLEGSIGRDRLNGDSGLVPKDSFVMGNRALDLGDRFLYEKATGRLIFDTNSSVAGGRRAIAILTNTPNLTAADIQIV